MYYKHCNTEQHRQELKSAGYFWREHIEFLARQEKRMLLFPEIPEVWHCEPEKSADILPTTTGPGITS
jgi:hypothetical protein